MSQLHVPSTECMASFRARSKVLKFAPHIDESNADFAQHMEGSGAETEFQIQNRSLNGIFPQNKNIKPFIS